MALNKTTRYALYAAAEMARAGDASVTVRQVAERYGASGTALAKVFQQLVRSGVASGTRGVGGGYRLAKRASEVSVLDVVEIFEPPQPTGPCLVARGSADACRTAAECSVQALFGEVDELVRNTFASVTLDTLARLRAKPAAVLTISRARRRASPRAVPRATLS